MNRGLFDFHGVRIAVAAEEPALVDAIGLRLRQFAVHEDEGDHADLEFEYRFVPARGDHVVVRPDGNGRPVYDPPAGEVTYFECDDVFFVDYDGRVRVLADPARGTVSVSILEAERERLWLLSRPMFTLPLVEMLKRRGLYNVHAAGVEANGSAVLVAGASGSGKSTLAVALVRGGLGLLGDDMLFAARNGQGVVVRAFPDEIDVAGESVAWFPELDAALEPVRGEDWPKRQLRAEELYAAPPAREARPGAILLPRITPRDESALVPLSRDEALLALVPNVLLTDPRSSQAHLDALGDLVAASECYRLEAARDFERIASLVRALV